MAKYPSAMKNEKEVLELIKERRSSRVPFDPGRPIAKADLDKILEAGSWAPTAHNMQNFEIVIVDDGKVLKKISKIKGQISMTFIKENYTQLSFSKEELLKKKTGIMGNMFPRSWVTPGAKIDKNSDTRPMFSSPLLSVVLYDPAKRAPASGGDFLGIMSLGCVMENMWIMASALGLSFHVVSSLGSGSMEKEVKRILGIPKRLRIAFTFRLGYPAAKPETYLRVRRDIQDFTHHNRYRRRTSGR
jgi:nitroreductase